MIAVCITTYNEEASIASLVKEFARFGDNWYRVYVVDDGSTDDTVLEAFNAGAYRVWQTGGQCGIGPCLMKAWELALADDPLKIIQIDAGGSHDPKDVLTMALAGYGVDLVIGSRFMPGGHFVRPWEFAPTSGLRPFLSKAAALACNWMQGTTFKDWTSGYRIFSPRLLRALLQVPYECKMHGWQIEVLGYAMEFGAVVREAPITYTAGRSSFNRKVAWEALKAFRRLWGDIGWTGSNLREIDLDGESL
jgi:dolichol-phosphate mannosyltransferase